MMKFEEFMERNVVIVGRVQLTQSFSLDTETSYNDFIPDHISSEYELYLFDLNIRLGDNGIELYKVVGLYLIVGSLKEIYLSSSSYDEVYYRLIDYVKEVGIEQWSTSMGRS